jgi:hypothetical protein
MATSCIVTPWIGGEVIRNMPSRLLYCIEDATESSDVVWRIDSIVAKIMLYAAAYSCGARLSLSSF